MNIYYIAVSTLSCIAIAILAILIHENGRLNRDTKHKFYHTYILIILANLAELFAWILNGAPESTIILHTVLKAADYILSPMAIAFFIEQIYESKTYKKIFRTLFVLSTALNVASIFTGWTFYIDEHNIYHHGPFFIVYAVMYGCAILAVIIGFYNYGKRYKKDNKLSLISISSFIIIAIVLQEVVSANIRTCCLALTVGAILQFIHFIEFSQQVQDEEISTQKNLLERDPLTKLYNRYAYEEFLKNYKESGIIPEDLVVVSIDVNGLKVVNDTLGHAAGDELIRGAAEVISASFDPYGSTFRTGGDEFMALLNCTKEQIQEIKENFLANVSSWHGELVPEVSVSAGHVRAADYPGSSVEYMATVADELMYDAKENYYKAKGIDRTGRKAAFEILNKYYEKILKVNLKEDSFGVLRAGEKELTPQKGYTDTLSGWLENFANSPNLYPGDYDEFMSKTQIADLRRFFSAGNKYSSVHYRRLMNGEYKPAIMELIAAEDYSKDNQIIFLYVKDISR